MLLLFLLLLLPLRRRWDGRKRTELDVVVTAAAAVIATTDHRPTKLQLTAAPTATRARGRYRRDAPNRHGRQRPLSPDGSRCGRNVASQTQILVEARAQSQQHVGRARVDGMVRVGVVVVGVTSKTDDATPTATA